MNKLSIGVMVAALSSPLALAEGGGWGIGITHGLSNDNTNELIDATGNLGLLGGGVFISVIDPDDRILFPIKLGNGLVVEPFFGYATGELDAGAGLSVDLDAYTLGAGLFATMHASERTSFYVGGRAWYSEGEGDNSAGGGMDIEIDGYGLAPTVGATFSPAPNFQIGIEAYLRYVDGEVEAGTGPGSELDFDSLDTGANLVFRYFSP